jgi:hypothetical protein
MIMRTELELDRMELPLVHEHYNRLLKVAMINAFNGELLTQDEHDYLNQLDEYIQRREKFALEVTLGLYNQGVPEVEA